jgi:hypothetical protein
LEEEWERVKQSIGLEERRKTGREYQQRIGMEVWRKRGRECRVE